MTNPTNPEAAPTAEICRTCEGTGNFFDDAHECILCRGTGYVSSEKAVEVIVDAVDATPEMTLSRAVEVLNEQMYRGHRWAWSEYHQGAVEAIPSEAKWEQLDEFATVAIAEKYEREGTK